MYKLGLAVVLILVSFQNWAVSVSTYRIYLDRANNIDDYWVSNKTTVTQECHLDFTHYTFDAQGNIQKYSDDNFIPENSASKVTRFSPKRFTISPKSKQKIRFSLRNRRNINEIEYRAHIIISCTDKEDNSDQINANENFAAVTVKPILRHHIPLVVRPRKLDVNLEIDNIYVDKDEIRFYLNRSGKRSLYGQINIKNQDGELITSSRKFPLYHEVTSKYVSIALPEFEAKSVIIEFVEEDELEDNIIIRKNFALN